ncbi:MEIOTIC F-BOX protein MOF-like [Lolium perenne]|uniref:MEIOTIC F-BOX protein MOF-like n=1 Tax=Lolium perenne TaxID=4522 RepID=UPI0021F57500|nr:MEIOTIC F-BOX protein MOF-like [Lolium perenne]
MLRKVEDRLSALPDDLLHAVLSRLKARQAVQTCVLSTRWRYLWRSVPRLDIDQQEFRPAGDDYSIREVQSFKNFVHILLHRHDVAHLEEFRLDVSYAIRKYADSWVRHGIGQDDVWPCRLKRLHLRNVILDDYFARHVRFRCPSLQEMELTNCTNLLSEASVITPSSLKKLVVNDYLGGTPFGLILEAPALASLCLAGYVDFIVENETPLTLPSLVDASIYMHEIKMLNDGIFLREDRTGNQMQLLRKLANVTTLELSGLGVFQVHDDCLGLNFPQFTNLRTLSLDHCDLCDNFLLLKHFLRNSPNLMKLVLYCCKLSDPEPREGVLKNIASYPQDMGDVIYENLRLTEIIYRFDDVHLLVEFLLGLSRNLPNNKVELSGVDY